ncbi:MAG: tRNA (adenosine(37)-N6)-threonylcarbamoyltransferase complex dimerization subunit type 1 TsaB [Saprospiraceae bacterium]|nr:tRNA (adenosine(37)-N6)-threonylcarbamoyltransferase complex dimerization subunit type 1 TsaB [Saprospiraceae bacterium]
MIRNDTKTISSDNRLTLADLSSEGTDTHDLILCLETATEVCSVAIGRAGRTLTIHEIDSGYVHASQLSVLVERCLADLRIALTEVAAVAVSSGPGSYTGLRVGISAAKGYCMALSIPLIGIDTLTCLAQGARATVPGVSSIRYIPMIDARRMEVYTAQYDENLSQIRAAEALILDENSFQDEINTGKQLVCTGNGAHKFAGIFHHSAVKFINKPCSASDLMVLAEERFREKNYSTARFFTPIYLKSPHITQPNKVL